MSNKWLKKKFAVEEDDSSSEEEHSSSESGSESDEVTDEKVEFEGSSDDEEDNDKNNCTTKDDVLNLLSMINEHGSLKFHKLARKIQTETDNIQSRLQSVRYDSEFVSDVKKMYPSFGLFANLRCGQWYCPSYDDTCYFKSTDGHFGQWEFSTMRLNINVLIAAYRLNGLIIVDSTRRGKSFPDALSKTVPIWMSVMNRLIYRYCKGENMTVEPGLELPYWLSKSEISQIEARMERFVATAVDKTIDWNDFFNNRHKELFTYMLKDSKRIKYMRCLWLHKGKDIEFSNLLNNDNLDFIPIICVSASDPNFPEKSFSWRYIPGAGDDHESWSEGLTPQMFYANADNILEDRISVEETERRVHAIVLENAKQFSKDHSEAAMVAIGRSPQRLFLGKNAPRYQFSSTVVFAIIMCQDPDDIKNQSIEYSGALLRLPIKDHKKYKNCLGQNLSAAIQFATLHLAKGHNLLITDDTGNNESVALLVGIMCATFGDEGANKDVFLGSELVDPSHLTKVHIRQRLSYIQSYHNNSNPSRNLMKQLNRSYL